jgi:hypothetical protein
VSGPGIAWYLGIAAFLFGIGALGVLIRRNPLIVLLSLELMLNGANLALIAFARHAHNGAGERDEDGGGRDPGGGAPRDAHAGERDQERTGERRAEAEPRSPNHRTTPLIRGAPRVGRRRE